MIELMKKMTGSGMIYIPKEVRDSFGAALRIMSDARAAVVFPEGAHLNSVGSSNLQPALPFLPWLADRTALGIQETDALTDRYVFVIRMT